MRNLLMAVTLAFSAFGCGTSKTKLTEDGKNVSILPTKKNSRCSVVEKVRGENDKGSIALAKNHARNLAADAGANSIHFDDIIQNGPRIEIPSTAYHCP